MFETILAADLGSSQTRLASKNEILTEESRAALDPEDTCRVLEVGDRARRLLNTAEAFPVRNGAIADAALAAVMLRRFALKLIKRRPLFGASLTIAAPLAAKPIERAAALEAGRSAGFRRVRIVDSLLAGAEGAGLDITGPGARMLADIGRDSVKTAVFASGGIIAESFARFGSSAADRGIRTFLAEEHRLLVGTRTAERLKKSLGAPLIRVNGRDASTGLPVSRDIRPGALREAADAAARLIAREIVSAATSIPPEAAADLVSGGVTLIGGGSMQFGLPERLEELLGVPVFVAPNAECAVIFGLQQQIRRAAFADLAELTARAHACGIK